MSEQIKEEWRPIVGYEGLYEVSNTGLVRRISYKKARTTKILKQSNRKRYKKVLLSKNGITKCFSVHRIVAYSFLENPNNHTEINHKDENTENNCVENLEWCTVEYNNNYGNRNKKISESLSKPVFQYDLQFNLIKVWKSACETRNYGFNTSNVSKCCRKERLTHKGFIWSFAKIEEEKKKYIIKNIHDAKKQKLLAKKSISIHKRKKTCKRVGLPE